MVIHRFAQNFILVIISTGNLHCQSFLFHKFTEHSSTHITSTTKDITTTIDKTTPSTNMYYILI